MFIHTYAAPYVMEAKATLSSSLKCDARYGGATAGLELTSEEKYGGKNSPKMEEENAKLAAASRKRKNVSQGATVGAFSGALVGGGSGAGVGAVIGAIFGSVIPGPGTAVGAAIGATIGGIAGAGTLGGAGTAIGAGVAGSKE